MKAILLAAGRGSRMGAATAEQPKCFTVVNGRRLIDYQLAALREAGIRDIAIVRGYQGHLFGDIAPDLVFFDNPRWAQTQMVSTLRCASAWLRAGPCIVSYSDILYGAAAIDSMHDPRGEVLVAFHTGWYPIWQARFSDPLMDAETFATASDGRLTEIGGKAESLDEICGQYMGLVRFSPAGWAAAEETLLTIADDRRDRVDMTGLLRTMLSRGIRIETVGISSEWWEFDSSSDVQAYESRTGHVPAEDTR
jgi:choline kinase